MQQFTLNVFDVLGRMRDLNGTSLSERSDFEKIATEIINGDRDFDYIQSPTGTFLKLDLDDLDGG